MTFVAEDYYDLIRLLHEHPEWRAELRQLVLSDELLTLPEVVRELTEAQRQTEVQLRALASQVEALAEAQQRTEARLEALVEAQLHTEARLEALTQRVDALAEAQQRTEARLEALTQRVDALAEAQLRTEARVDALAADIQRLTNTVHWLSDRVGDMRGDLLESRYREHAAGYFGQWVRRAKAVAPVELEETLEQKLKHDEVLDFLRLDLLINGQWRESPEALEIWLATEVASIVDEGDIARAWRRAHLLRKAGYRAMPVVAGEQITDEAQASARAQTVGVVLDGQGALEDENLAIWLADQ